MRPAQGPRARDRALACVLALACALALASALAGCSNTTSHPAAAAVERLLELRRDRATDVSAYAPLVADSEVATALADAAKAATSTVAPLPAWKAPYVSAETSVGASVIVVWKADAAHPGWPAANRFAMRLVSGRWVVADAAELTAKEIPPPLENK